MLTCLFHETKTFSLFSCKAEQSFLKALFVMDDLQQREAYERILEAGGGEVGL